MKRFDRTPEKITAKAITFKGGKLCFTAKAERTFYFVLTICMLLLGILVKLKLI